MSLPAGAVLYNVLIVGVIWSAAALALFGFKNDRFIRFAVNFSAGVLLGVAFLHMMPEAFVLLGHERAGFFVLLGYLSIFLLERFVMVHPCEEGDCDYHMMGFAALAGFSIHSFLGGVALGSALLVPGLGAAVFLATVVHKGPEAFSLTSLLVIGNEKRSKVLWLVALFSVMVPFGTAMALAGLPYLGSPMVGGAVALSSGTFLYLATGDLLPGLHSKDAGRVKALVGFLIGIGFTLLAKWWEK